MLKSTAILSGVAICALCANNARAAVDSYIWFRSSLPSPNLVVQPGTPPKPIYANTAQLRNVHMSLSSSSTQTTLTSGSGPFQIHSFFDVFTELSLDGGNTWIPESSPGSPVTITGNDGGAQGVFSTEMTQLDTSFTTPGVLLRESPTLASTGSTTITPENGNFRISSFFDVFTELSIDGGNTWSPTTNGPLVLEGTPEPASLSLLGIGGVALLRRRRREG